MQVWRSWQCRPPAAQTNGNIPRVQEQEPVAAVITTTHIQTREWASSTLLCALRYSNWETRGKKPEIQQSSGLIGSVGIFSFVFSFFFYEACVCVCSLASREGESS